MRILFVTEDLANGGSERVVSVLANELSKENDVGIVALRRNRVVYDIRSEVAYFPFENENAGKIERTLGRLKLLRGSIKAFEADVVVAFDVVPIVYSYLCCKHSHTKLIVSERADPARHKKSGFLGNNYFKAFSNADGVVFQTTDARDFFSEEIKSRSAVIPNPINESFDRERFDGERSKEIVTACRLTNQKNLKLFIDIVNDVCRIHPEYKGIIYGEGQELDALTRYACAQDFPDRIVFAGHSDHIADDIYKSRFYLCTSDYEGISNSMLEAMTLGLTVISTDCPVGGARMAITSGSNGILFPVGDKNAAVKALNELILDAAEADRLGTEAAQIKDRWSVRAISEEWAGFIRKLL